MNAASLFDSVPTSFGLLYAFAIGAIVGSYLNVVIHRVPRGQSTFRPRSRCGACGTGIAWYDNVPVISYVLLRGRCRRCSASYSPRYPLVEACTAVLFAAVFVKFEFTWTTPVAWLFVSMLVALALIDFEHLLLPDRITLPGLLLGLATSFVSDLTGPFSAGLGALFGALILLALIAVYYLLRGELGMGLGDPKMLAMIGAFLGLGKTIATVFMASLAGTLVSTVLILARRADRRTKMPFGVYLAIGALGSLFFGDRLVDTYLSGW